ncbi:MAG: uroporphyrinogen decarboxylase family protein [Candidatus Helarchaeota archaeon]
MNFRDRILTTFNHEEPDRVPVMSLLMEPSNFTKYTGKVSTNYFKYLQKPLLGKLIKILMNWNWAWNSDFYRIYEKILQVSIELGFDASWMYYLLFKLKKDTSLSLGYSWFDIWGRKWEIYIVDRGDPEPQYIGGHCNTEEKWDNWVNDHAQLFNKFPKFVEQFYKRLMKDYGDQIYIIGFAAPGIFENSWQPIGFVEFSKLMYKKPSFIEKVVEFQTELYIKYIDAICKAGNEIILIGDDLGQKTGPLINPKLLDRFFSNAYKRVSEFIHNKNKKILFHSCGNIYKLLDKFIEWGFDGLLTLEPTAGMELGEVRKRVGHKLVLVGNIDVSYLLVKGSKKEIEGAVKKTIKDAAKGGGFILSPSHNHSDVDPTRLKWMIEATHKYGEYPLE